jgi:hypothetical protein
MLDDTVARGANGVVVTWRVFGSSGIVDWSRTPVTEQYTRAAPRTWNKGWGVKTLFRYDPAYWKLGIHRPAIRNKWLDTDFPGSVKWLNGSGQPMEDYFKFRGWRSIRRTVGFDWAQMNHYAVKSVDAYAIRRFRGNVNNKADKYDAGYWALQDRNEVDDRAILRHAPRRAEIMETLLSDRVLSRLHHAALDRVEAQLAEFRATPDYTALRDSLFEASRVPIDEVEAKPPKPRDPEKIAAIMRRAERQATVNAERADADGGPYRENDAGTPPEAVEWIENHGIALPADPRLFTPAALDAVRRGRFERRHARNIADYLDGHTRLLEIGTGLAFIPLRALSAIPSLVVMGQDSRAGLIRQARCVALRAGFDDRARLTLRHEDLDPEDDDGSEAAGLAYMLAAFRPTVLRIACRDQLSSDSLKPADLSSVTRILLPFGSKAEMAELRRTYGEVLRELGFAEAEGGSANGTLQFDRRR